MHAQKNIIVPFYYNVRQYFDQESTVKAIFTAYCEYFDVYTLSIMKVTLCTDLYTTQKCSDIVTTNGSIKLSFVSLLQYYF